MATNEPLNIYIGWDSRESVCSHVAAHSIIKRTQSPLNIRYLKHRELRKLGVFNRPWLIDGQTGNFTDLVDTKPFSTEFSHTRFLVPLLQGYQGWALFMDADMVFLSDIAKLFALKDDKYAAMCVKHLHHPDENTAKMDGRLQSKYHRKNWSSFVLWNCGHPANKGITPAFVNNTAGKDMHAFSWLPDNLIGSLPFTYNYISGISPKFSLAQGNRPDVVHYTEGGPWFEECKDVPHGHSWQEEYEDWQNTGAGNKVSDVKTTFHEERRK